MPGCLTLTKGAATRALGTTWRQVRSGPDGAKEDLGITQLDEPALNCEDKTVLELKYVQSKNVVRAAPVSVDSIENADKKPKEISRWINSV